MDECTTTGARPPWPVRALADDKISLAASQYLTDAKQKGNSVQIGSAHFARGVRQDSVRKIQVEHYIPAEELLNSHLHPVFSPSNEVSPEQVQVLGIFLKAMDHFLLNPNSPEKGKRLLGKIEYQIQQLFFSWRECTQLHH